MPRISVIIPAYNYSGFISAALKSVEGQSYSDHQIVVVDDGSTDDTGEVVSRFAGVTYIRQENRGLPGARNVGIKASDAEFVAFLDADDVWLPNKLKRQVAAIEDSRCGWVYSDAFAFDDASGRRLTTWSVQHQLREGAVLNELLLDDFIPMPTVMVRRSVFEEVGYFDEDARFLEDWEMWLRIAGNWRLGLVNEQLAGVRVHSRSKSRNDDVCARADEGVALINRVANRNFEALRLVRRRAIGRLYARTARRLLGVGNMERARQYSIGGIRCAPRDMDSYAVLLMSALGARLNYRLIEAYRNAKSHGLAWRM